MNEEWRKVVLPRFTDIVTQLKPGDILMKLLEKGVIKEGEFNRLQRVIHNKCEEDCNKELLTQILNKRGPNSVKEFVELLKDTDQQHIADLLAQTQVEPSAKDRTKGLSDKDLKSAVHEKTLQELEAVTETDGGKLMGTADTSTSSAANKDGQAQFKAQVFPQQHKKKPLGSHPLVPESALDQEKIGAKTEATNVVPVIPCPNARITLGQEPNWDYDVFICHEGESKPFANQIFQSLAGHHIRAFLDVHSIDGTQNICPSLSKAIKKSRFVMVILTQKFINKTHPTYEFHLARERHRAEKYSTNLGVVLPIFYTISPNTVSQYLDIQTATGMAGYTRRPENQSDDDFLSQVVIPRFSQLVTKVVAEREVLISGRLKLVELIRKAGLPQEWVPHDDSDSGADQ